MRKMKLWEEKEGGPLQGEWSKLSNEDQKNSNSLTPKMLKLVPERLATTETNWYFGILGLNVPASIK